MRSCVGSSNSVERTVAVAIAGVTRAATIAHTHMNAAACKDTAMWHLQGPTHGAPFMHWYAIG
jgi:hypothetical protein